MTGVDIRKIREELGVSQAAFAHLLKISFSTLNRWENGKSIPDAEMTKLLEGLRELLDQEKVDKKKVLESIETAGVASAVTLAAAAGLIRFPAISVLLGPVGFAVGALASLFLKDLRKNK